MMMRSLVVIAMVGACGPTSALPNGETTGSATTETASVGPTETGGESSGPGRTTVTGATATATVTGATASTTDVAETEDGPTVGCGFICAPDLGGEEDCDGWNMPDQDCPRGQKCTIDEALGETHCVDVIDDKQRGEPCTMTGSGWSGFDDCGVGLLCWDVDEEGHGRCIELCVGSLEAPSCPTSGDVCTLCQECAIGLCLFGCDPLLQDCSGGDACIGDPNGGGFLCVLDASGDEGQVHDACMYANACDPGLLCLDSEAAVECDQLAQGCCEPLCDLSAADPELPCVGAGQVCTPYYEQGLTPEGYEDVGVCMLP